MLRAIILSFVLVLSSTYVLAQESSAIRVSMLIPKAKSSLFYEQLRKIMQLAAHSLDIELELLYSNGDPVQFLNLAEEITKRELAPDYVILVGRKGVTGNAIRRLDEAKIKTALLIGSLPSDRLDEFREGNTKLKYWVGSIFPNEQQAGYILAKHLFAEARRLNLAGNDKIETMVLLGSRRAHASQQRLQGLKQYISEHPDIHLHHSYYADWNEELAGAYTYRSLSAGKTISVIWSAGDAMAIGAINAAEKLNYRPGDDILLGSVDWVPEAMPYIKNGSLHGSVGGHVLDGAWMLVLLHDHFHKLNDGFFEYETGFSFVGEDNIELLQKITDIQFLEKINFQKFSKLYRGEEEYDFAINRLFAPQ